MASRLTSTGRFKTVLRRLGDLNARLFRPRQILLRSDDRVHALMLGARIQQFAAGTVAVALTWTVISTAALYWQSDRIEGKKVELARAERAYSELLAEVETARADVIGLATSLPESLQGDGMPAVEEGAGEAGTGTTSASDLPLAIGRLQKALDALAERNGRLADKLAEAQQDLDESRLRTAALTAKRVGVERALERTQRALDDAQLNRTGLHARLSELRADLRSAHAQQQASQQGRLDAEARVAELEKSLDTARKSEGQLKADVARLEDSLARSEKVRHALVAERENLAGKVGRLERAMGGGVPLRGSLGDRISGLESALSAAEERGDALQSERDALHKQVVSLRQAVDQLKTQRSGLVERVSASALYGLEAIEKTIAMTGLDVDAVAKRVRAEHSGMGGPFVEASFHPSGAPGEPADVERLDQQMQRLVALQTALGAMPLTAPVDSYWISSNFGKRRDPYNGRWALHEGLDLAATAGSPVFAAAPGKVVFAGSKSGYGRMVEIDHGFGLHTRYGHLRSIQVKKGQRVTHRQTIGALGSSGRSTGPHVHYEIRVEGEPVDPSNFLKAGKHVFKG